MRLSIASKKAAEYACLYFHYAKRVPQGYIAFNVFNDDDEWCGCILYARGASPQIGKPYGLAQGQVVELVRVALNGKQGHTSQAVSMSLKMLKKECPLVRLVVSFADCDQNYLGTIYQATNWIYTGTPGVDVKGTKQGQYVIFGKPTHCRTVEGRLRRIHKALNLENVRKYIDPTAYILNSEGKRKYLYPLDKKMRKAIQHLSKPYPKTDPNWTKVDRSQFIEKYDDEKMERGGQSRTAISQVEPARSTVELSTHT